MANFSSGAAQWGFFMIFMVLPISWLFMIPAMFFVWSGFARPLMEDDGTIDYAVLKRRLDRVLLPICAIGFALFLGFFLLPRGMMSEFMIAEIGFTALLMLPHTLGLYVTARLSALLLHKLGRLTAGLYKLCLLVPPVVFIAVIVVLFVSTW
jgi:hypothetical protein